MGKGEGNVVMRCGGALGCWVDMCILRGFVGGPGGGAKFGVKKEKCMLSTGANYFSCVMNRSRVRTPLGPQLSLNCRKYFKNIILS